MRVVRLIVQVLSGAASTGLGAACRADLKATFGSKRHELNVSTYQMVVLLLFNSADRLSYREIQAATAIAPAELKRSLQSLACVKVASVTCCSACVAHDCN